MINAEFKNKKFKIYASGKITYPDATNDEIKELSSIIENIKAFYGGPSCGFLVGFIAKQLPIFDVTVLSYRDYECENAKPGTIY